MIDLDIPLVPEGQKLDIDLEDEFVTAPAKVLLASNSEYVQARVVVSNDIQEGFIAVIEEDSLVFINSSRVDEVEIDIDDLELDIKDTFERSEPVSRSWENEQE